MLIEEFERNNRSCHGKMIPLYMTSFDPIIGGQHFNTQWLLSGRIVQGVTFILFNPRRVIEIVLQYHPLLMHQDTGFELRTTIVVAKHRSRHKVRRTLRIRVFCQCCCSPRQRFYSKYPSWSRNKCSPPPSLCDHRIRGVYSTMTTMCLPALFPLFGKV